MSSPAYERQESTPDYSKTERLAYDILESCRRDGICRSSKYQAISPDSKKRGGLPFLPSFTVGRRRLIMADDHRQWLETLRAASLNAPGASAIEAPEHTASKAA